MILSSVFYCAISAITAVVAGAITAVVGGVITAVVVGVITAVVGGVIIAVDAFTAAGADEAERHKLCHHSTSMKRCAVQNP